VPTAWEIGYEDVRFTSNAYAQSVKRRERMTNAERAEHDRASAVLPGHRSRASSPRKLAELPGAALSAGVGTAPGYAPREGAR